MGRKSPENAKEWLERYETRYARAFDNYQSTGDAKYDRQVYEYDCICTAFRALIEKKEERNYEIEHRIQNKNWAIDKLCNASYTRAEVIKLLNEAVYW